jgi:hypothetical protein
MQDRGWPAPVIVESGNGYGMFWRCDLPNDDVVKAAYRRWLSDLSERFGGAGGKIDKAVYEAELFRKAVGHGVELVTPAPDSPSVNQDAGLSDDDEDDDNESAA